MTGREYYVVGLLPVKLVPTPDGGRAVLKMSWETGAFELDHRMWERIHLARDGVESLSEDEFVQRVEALRARRLSGDGPIFALYGLQNGIEDVAREEGRALRPDEEALLVELRRESHALFQAEHPDPG